MTTEPGRSAARRVEDMNMLERILAFSIRRRWLVLIATLAIAALGVVSYERLPIDAVPDITNVQVQINAEAPGRYYIKTADMLNRTATSPPGAPANTHSFTASPDTAKPVITHTPIPDIPKLNWPATVNAVVTDNIGIDSVWVRWYKNNTGTGVRQFKLTNTGGSNYSAAFNSDTSQVAFNESIFYRIIAQDNSSAHNKDSTALYKFKILAVANSCIGTGTLTAGYPYYTFYEDSRTQMLYTSSEIISNGGAPGNISINLKSEAGRAILRRMLATADVVLENFRPGTMEKLGLGYDTLHAANPGLIYCQLTGFGATGPYADRAGFGLIAQGMSGLMSLTGEGPGRPPVKAGVPITDMTAGILGVVAILAA